jgi:hypothetical protein
MTLGEQVASTQYSICLELLLHARTMLGEILSLGVSATAATHVEPSVAPVKQFVLTGGLSQSPYFQQIFHTGIGMIAPDASGMLSAREGPLRFQTAAYGALINSMRPDPEAPPSEQLCPLIAIPAPSDPAKRAMQRLLSAGGL